MVHNLQIAIEVAMASAASTADVEDGPILNERDVCSYIEIVMRGLLGRLNLMVFIAM